MTDVLLHRSLLLGGYICFVYIIIYLCVYLRGQQSQCYVTYWFVDHVLKLGIFSFTIFVFGFRHNTRRLSFTVCQK